MTMNERTVTGAGPDAGQSLLIDVRGVARLFAVSSQTVRRLDGQGLIPAPIRIGRAVRWYRPHVVGWLAEQSASAARPQSRGGA
jgi:predicted DNA-binding transcriptional regulator AlpA